MDGKEAANMFRRAVFALMLIGAAFAGGAAINGPGLAWLQRNFAGGPSIIVDVASARPSAEAKNAPRQFPTAKAPPLQVDFPQASPPPPGKTAKAPASTELLAQVDPPLLPESPSTPASALAPLPDPTSAGEADPPVPPLPPAAGASPRPSKPPGPEPAGLPPLDPRSIPKSDPVARLASIERPEPTTAEATSTAASPTWAELRKRMKALGVVRYTIEAETDGRVRFTCVIPVDGLKAVGHHFEAEGDDEPQAAEAALKRIALWKATTPD